MTSEVEQLDKLIAAEIEALADLDAWISETMVAFDAIIAEEITDFVLEAGLAPWDGKSETAGDTFTPNDG